MQQDPSIPDAQLDRLVDGELRPDEERQLLARLEATPGGWRQCALAFVEAQAWRCELSALTRPSLNKSREGRFDGAPRVPPVQSSTARSLAAFAIAASLLIAFSAGWLWPRGGEDSQPSLQVAGQVEPPAPSPPSPQESLWPNVIDPSQMMRVVVMQPDGSTRPLLVPLLEEQDVNRLAGGVTEAGISPALPNVVRQQLEQAGYQIQQRRRYAPLSLESGRRMIVPVEDTHIVPVRAGVY